MKSWYMTNYTPNVTGGFESDAISEYAESNFTDILEVAYSDTVLLYSEDISTYKQIQCVIQGNTADTQLKSMERTLLVPINTVKAGMYVYFENSFWIIDGRPGNNKSYEKATLKLCQYMLNWQTSDGKLHSRPVSATSASKYDVGLENNKTITLPSNNYCVLIGYDEDSIQLDYQRVFIDRAKANPTKVFKLTRDDDILCDFGDKGSILSFIVDRDEFNPERDNQEFRICDYKPIDNPVIPTPTPDPTPTPEPSGYTVVFSGSKTLRIGRAKKWTATVLDSNGNNVDFTWNIVSDIDVESTISNESVELNVVDENAGGAIIKLEVLVDGKVIDSFDISVKEAW